MTIARAEARLEEKNQGGKLGRQGRFKFKFTPTGEEISLKKLCRLYGINYARTNRRLIGCNALEDSLFSAVGYKGKMGEKTVPDWWGTVVIPMCNKTNKEIPCRQK